MKPKEKSPQKIFFQKGQGMLEYALLFSFISVIFLFVFSGGSFGHAIKNLFGSSNDSLANVNYDNIGGETSSNSASTSSPVLDSSSNSSAETATADTETSSSDSNAETTITDNTAPVSYKPLNWERDILPFSNMTYATITNPDNPNNTVDNALSSEIGFFDTLLSAAEGGLASTRASDGTKDWESFLSMVDKTKAANNFSSVYVRDEQKITVKTVGKDLRITYSVEPLPPKEAGDS